jgi:ABC-2 type transport system permease protein
MKALVAQTGAEVRLTLRRGESLLVTLGIPLGLLVFFSLVDVGFTDSVAKHPVDFVAPGVLALAVMSTAMVSLGIATGFERQYGVLKRLATTPLGRPRLLAAKTVSILLVEVVQLVVLVPIALLLGWDPRGNLGLGLVAILVGTVAFAGLGLLMAGALRAEVTLAAANGIYLVLLLLGGMVIPLSKFPGALHDVADLLPAAPLSNILHDSAGVRSWLALVAWAILMPLAAAVSFRWE